MPLPLSRISDPPASAFFRSHLSSGAQGRRILSLHKLQAVARGLDLHFESARPFRVGSCQAGELIGTPSFPTAVEGPVRLVSALLDAKMRRLLLDLKAAACVELGRSGEAAAVGILAAVLEREGSGLAVAAAGALGETGSAAAEAPLLHMGRPPGGRRDPVPPSGGLARPVVASAIRSSRWPWTRPGNCRSAATTLRPGQGPTAELVSGLAEAEALEYETL